MTPPDHAICMDCNGSLWKHNGTSWTCSEYGLRDRAWNQLLQDFGPIDVFIHRSREEKP